MTEGRKVLQKNRKAEDRINDVWMSQEAKEDSEEDLDVEKFLFTFGVLK